MLTPNSRQKFPSPPVHYATHSLSCNGDSTFGSCTQSVSPRTSFTPRTKRISVSTHQLSSNSHPHGVECEPKEAFVYLACAAMGTQPPMMPAITSAENLAIASSYSAPTLRDANSQLRDHPRQTGSQCSCCPETKSLTVLALNMFHSKSAIVNDEYDRSWNEARQWILLGSCFSMQIKGAGLEKGHPM